MARGHNRDFGLILITLAFVATNSRICHGHHVIHFCEKCVLSMDIEDLI